MVIHQPTLNTYSARTRLSQTGSDSKALNSPRTTKWRTFTTDSSTNTASTWAPSCCAHRMPLRQALVIRTVWTDVLWTFGEVRQECRRHRGSQRFHVPKPAAIVWRCCIRQAVVSVPGGCDSNSYAFTAGLVRRPVRALLRFAKS